MHVNASTSHDTTKASQARKPGWARFVARWSFLVLGTAAALFWLLTFWYSMGYSRATTTEYRGIRIYGGALRYSWNGGPNAPRLPHWSWFAREDSQLQFWFASVKTPSTYDCWIPFWPFALAALSIAAPLWWFDLRAYRRAHVGLCPRCGYERRGLPPQAPCPECGAAVKPS